LQHLDAIEVDPEDFVRDLRQRRFVPLAVRVGADADLETSIRGQPHGRLLVSRHDGAAPSRQHRGSHRALLAEDRDPDADEPPVRLAPALTRADRGQADGRHRTTHGFRVVAAIELLLHHVLERHLIGTNQVSQSRLVRFDAGLAGDRIHNDFDRKAHAGPCHAAIGKDGALVCRHRRGATAVGVKIVGPRQQACHLRRLERG
jgi:hypothetical protein